MTSSTAAASPAARHRKACAEKGIWSALHDDTEETSHKAVMAFYVGKNQLRRDAFKETR